MDKNMWASEVFRRYRSVPEFRVAVKDACPDAGPSIYWETSLKVVADSVWSYVIARGSSIRVLAEIAGMPAPAEITLDAAKLQVMEAVAVHRGEKDGLGPRLSIYVEVPVTGWSAVVRGEILAWLADLATEVHIAGGVTLRFRPVAPTSQGGPILVG
jgi:hypothetical protein